MEFYGKIPGKQQKVLTMMPSLFLLVTIQQELMASYQWVSGNTARKYHLIENNIFPHNVLNHSTACNTELYPIEFLTCLRVECERCSSFCIHTMTRQLLLLIFYNLK